MFSQSRRLFSRRSAIVACAASLSVSRAWCESESGTNDAIEAECVQLSSPVGSRLIIVNANAPPDSVRDIIRSCSPQLVAFSLNPIEYLGIETRLFGGKPKVHGVGQELEQKLCKQIGILDADGLGFFKTINMVWNGVKNMAIFGTSGVITSGMFSFALPTHISGFPAIQAAIEESKFGQIHTHALGLTPFVVDLNLVQIINKMTSEEQKQNAEWLKSEYGNIKNALAGSEREIEILKAHEVMEANPPVSGPSPTFWKEIRMRYLAHEKVLESTLERYPSVKYLLIDKMGEYMAHALHEMNLQAEKSSNVELNRSQLWTSVVIVREEHYESVIRALHGLDYSEGSRVEVEHRTASPSPPSSSSSRRSPPSPPPTHNQPKPPPPPREKTNEEALRDASTR